MPIGHVVTQLDVWDEWHNERDIDGPNRSQEELSNMLLSAIHPSTGKRILELGCGQGHDAIRFAETGAHVYAADFSEIAIDKARKNAASAGVDIAFDQHDISDGRLPGFGVDNFDAVFCHLSLHYFTRSVTTMLFEEITRATRGGGIFAFMVKSIRDPFYGLGEPLEEHMFQRKGHVRHFFSREYTQELLRSDWLILSIDEPSGCYQSTARSSFIRVLARKR